MGDYAELKKRQQETWSTGDFAVIGWNTAYPGERLCEAVRLRAGDKVLDVASGAGNVALSAARRNCEAVGVDYVPGLIERARARAAAERLPARFEIADCEQLPYPDQSFDCVLSLFGSMFAPDQEQAARELVRVCRAGGQIGLGNWTPEGFWGQTFALIARYVPPPPGVRPPPEWGTEKRLHELFGAATRSITTNQRSALFRFRDSKHWIEVFSTWFGPIMAVLDKLDDEACKQFLDELESNLQRFNRSGDHTLMVSADYLEVVMVR
jgi:SAM-dependent methyltransferase